MHFWKIFLKTVLKTASLTPAGQLTACPTAENAHPHFDCSYSLALVHNGIIENYKPLKQKLQSLGHTFRSETDTEVVVHLIEQLSNDGLELRLAFLEALKSIEGTYGIAVISKDSSR